MSGSKGRKKKVNLDDLSAVKATEWWRDAVMERWRTYWSCMGRILVQLGRKQDQQTGGHWYHCFTRTHPHYSITTLNICMYVHILCSIFILWRMHMVYIVLLHFSCNDNVQWISYSPWTNLNESLCYISPWVALIFPLWRKIPFLLNE